MTTPRSMQDLNRELAQQILAEARANPQSAYAGKFVGIANGRIVVVADNWDEVANQLRHAEPDVRNTFCLEVDADYDAVQEIWGLR